MIRLARRLFIAVVLASVVTAASAVVPVRMAWAAPQVRFVELAAAAVPTVQVPFARLATSLRRSVTVPFALSHLGVRWTGSENAHLEVRTAPGAGMWGPWRSAEVSHDLGDDARRSVFSGLVRVDGARLVQVRARGDAEDVRLVAIDAVNGPRRLVRDRPRPAGADVIQPAVVSRSQWGADESMRRAAPEHAPVARMVVHHTVTANDDPDPASTIRAIYAYHVKANGWDDIGYNFLIDAAGRTYEGRYARSYAAGETPTGETADGRGVVGAHSEGQNSGSVGVALMGNFTERPPAQAAVDAVQRLLAWKAERHGIDPSGSTTFAGGRSLPTIVGHRDMGSTACPGDKLHARLADIRRAVAATVGAARAATTPGYWALGRDGRVLPFGRASASLAPLVAGLLAPAADIAVTPSGHGYWVLTEGGRVLAFGDALLLGSPELLGLLDRPGRAVAIEATPSGLGYWVAEEGGRVRAFGDAPNLGGAPAGPVAAMARTASGRGYWLALADGRVSAHGDARLMESAAGTTRTPIVAMAASEGGRGYWLVAGDGKVFASGDAGRAGGLPERRIAAKVVDAHATGSGRGYYLLAEDGALFTFGDADFHGAPTALGGGGAVGLAVMR